MNTKAISVSIILAAILIAGAVFLSKGGSSSLALENANNVSIVDGRQIVEISARGGYKPKVSLAKPGIPTILRFKTGGTFDCSSAVRIPSLNISRNLPQTGTTDIDIGTGQVGKLQGTCAMGMYPFEIDFQS